MNRSHRNEPRAANDRRCGNVARPTSASRWLLALIASSLSAGTLLAAVVPAWIGVDGYSARTQAVASATANDSPTIYQLPPVAVVASRKAELAKLAREEADGAVRHAARSKPAKPPA